ncbi:MAG: di-heme oxidoredictase family protein [Burkholderiales bacterium]
MNLRSFLAASTAVLTASAVVVAAAQSQGDRDPAWPPVTGRFVVKETYSDLPWHQKLGTYAGNQIDEAIVMPYDALPQADRDYCTRMGMSKDNPKGRADCMIEIGVSNILAMERVDTPYASFTSPVPPECKDSSFPCIEVTLKVSNRYTRSEGDTILLDRRVYGPDLPKGSTGIYYGYTLSDGNTYAPQMPWFTSHYCDAQFKPGVSDVQDPVCYGDFFSPFNNGFNARGGTPAVWPSAMPWSVWPRFPTNHCAEGITTCNMVLAAFDLQEVPPTMTGLQYETYNKLLLDWFNYGLQGFREDVSLADIQRKFPWTGKPMTWEDFYPYSATNPFVGTFADVNTVGPNVPGCDTTLTGPTPVANCNTTAQYRAKEFLYPRQCGLSHLAGGDAKSLRKCGLNYEIHHNGWITQWPDDWADEIKAASMYPANQYGRTSFLFAGVPGMQLPVSYLKVPGSPSGMSVYEQVYNTSVFSLYIPIANEADQKRAFPGRQYKNTEFYHTLLMTNHMEAEPAVFADGIRGKALWHNEYRMQGMYEQWRINPGTSRFKPEMFNASFDPATAPVPFHNSTCDGCHVRNGSGVPINTKRTLDAAQQVYMKGTPYNVHNPVRDYTFTGDIQPMKLVFFDLGSRDARADASRYSTPLAFTALTRLSPPRTAVEVYYSNAVMNYYGDAFHVTRAPNTYDWSFENIPPGDPSLVVNAPRTNPELKTTYTPWRVKVGSFQTAADAAGAVCSFTTAPSGANWPKSCKDIDRNAIAAAIGSSKVGYMLLNGKRLGNSGAIEAMPDSAIMGFVTEQQKKFGDAALAGELIFTVGSRNGIPPAGVVKKDCKIKSLNDCFIARFGWLGDRASLEDQVANAAFVEMNMTSSEGYERLYGKDGRTTIPIRYLAPNCGPANAACVNSKGNSDLSERDIERMADYARWIGNPTRSEFQVQLPEVVKGERVFMDLGCDSCHVIRKIPIVGEETMLSDAYMKRLVNRIEGTGANAIRPFLSYLGTDLLMHDMGYLSQVGVTSQNIRKPDGTVMDPYKTYVQKIRTPALKGMRFNRFVTDAHNNVKNPGDPACDFLMHDGRACDAIEAAFMHDGPAVKQLRMIEKMSTELEAEDIANLRAFLYSL